MKRIRGAILWVVVEVAAVSTGPTSLPPRGAAATRLRQRRLRRGLRERLGKALKPQVVVLCVPSDGGVRRGACAKALVTVQPAARGEARARVADDALVSQESEGA